MSLQIISAFPFHRENDSIDHVVVEEDPIAKIVGCWHIV
jgi:hypothetical protein